MAVIPQYAFGIQSFYEIDESNLLCWRQVLAFVAI